MCRNTRVESNLIHSFSSGFPALNPVSTIADYPMNFWMQGSAEDNPEGSDPASIREDCYLNLKLDSTLNRQNFVVEEQVSAAKRERIRPLILDAFR